MNVKNFARNLKYIFFVFLGILFATFGIEAFLLPNNFIDGGIMGLSMLVAKSFAWNLSLLIILLNIPFLLLAYLKVSIRFAIFSCISISLLSLCLLFVHFPELTKDKLLASVFGGVFLGAGIGLAIRGNSVLDGTEIFALLLSKKANITVGEVILILNICLFTLAGFLINIESALYSVLTYFSASRMLNFILHGIEEYTGITIMSEQNEQIKEEIFRQTKRGLTVYKGKGGYTDSSKDILFCVVTRLEIYKIKTIAQSIDPSCFIITQSLNEAHGGQVKRRKY